MVLFSRCTASRSRKWGHVELFEDDLVPFACGQISSLSGTRAGTGINKKLKTRKDSFFSQPTSKINYTQYELYYKGPDPLYGTPGATDSESVAG